MGKRRLGGYLGALPVGITTDINATKGIFSVDTALDRRLNSLWPTGSGPRNSYTGNSTIPVPAGVNSLRFSVQGQNGNGGGGKGGWLQGTIQANNLDTSYYVRQGVGGAQSGRDRPSGGQPNRRGGHYFAILNSASQGTLDADNDLVFMAGGGGGGARSSGGNGTGQPAPSSNQSGGPGGNQPSYPGGRGNSASVNGDESGDGGGGGGAGYRGGSGGYGGHYGGNGNWNQQSSGGGGGSSYMHPVVTSRSTQHNGQIPSSSDEFRNSNSDLGGNIVYVYLNY
jgi:hypothetical protein